MDNEDILSYIELVERRRRLLRFLVDNNFKEYLTQPKKKDSLNVWMKKDKFIFSICVSLYRDEENVYECSILEDYNYIKNSEEIVNSSKDLIDKITDFLSKLKF